MKIIKLLKKVKPIYIILGLFAVVLIVSALGSKTKEGMSSGNYLNLRKLVNKRNDILYDISNFIKAQSNNTTWGSTSTFNTNFQSFVTTYGNYSVKKFFLSKDLNNDGFVVVNKRENTFVRDNSNNNITDFEKFYYYDLAAQDKNKDNTILSYKNKDQGNFYKDNVDNSGVVITAASLSNTPYIVETIDSIRKVTKADSDAAKALVDAQIERLSTRAEKDTINKLINDLIEVMDKITELNFSAENIVARNYVYDPNNIIDYHSRAYEYSGFDELDLDPTIDPTLDPVLYRAQRRARRRAKRKLNRSRNNNSDLDAGESWDKNSSSNYWKNLYLNSLNTMSNQQTPVYGSLLNGSMPGNSTASYDISMPPVRQYDTSLTGTSATGTGTSTGLLGTSGTGTSLTGAGPIPSLASTNTNTRANTTATGAPSGPVQKTNDMFLLNSQNNQTNASPVPACGTAGSSCRPAPVPPCPPCERCPESKFECKKVPRYNSAANNQYLPKPVLASFTQFGM